MAQNITTVNEIRANNPQGAEPTLSDLLYMVHGTGSDQNRAYTMEEVRDLLQAVFTVLTLTNNGVTTTIDGEKVTVSTSSAGGALSMELSVGALLAMVYMSSSVKGVKLTGNGLEFLTDTETVSASMKYNENAEAVEFDKPVKTGEYLIGDYWKISRVNTSSGSAFVVSRFDGENWVDELIINTQGSMITLKQPNMTLGSWKFSQDQGNLYFKTTIQGTEVAGPWFSSSGSVHVPGRLSVDELVVSKNVVLATENVDLLSTPYSTYPAGTELTIVNDNDTGAITVTLGNDSHQATDRILNHTALKYVRSNYGWIRLHAFEPQLNN